MSKLRIVENRLVHIAGEIALEESLRKYTTEADICPDTPIVIITATLFEQLKLHSQLNSCA
jgi:hypothetical protein